MSPLSLGRGSRGAWPTQPAAPERCANNTVPLQQYRGPFCVWLKVAWQVGGRGLLRTTDADQVFFSIHIHDVKPVLEKRLFLHTENAMSASRTVLSSIKSKHFDDGKVSNSIKSTQCNTTVRILVCGVELASFRGGPNDHNIRSAGNCSTKFPPCCLDDCSKSFPRLPTPTELPCRPHQSDNRQPVGTR